MDKGVRRTAQKGVSVAPTLQEALDLLAMAIRRLTPVARSHLLWWLRKWAMMICEADSFDAATVPQYRRGDIFLADLGVNVGSEENYEHFCLVVEHNNPRLRETILVVPLSSDKGVPLCSGEVQLGYVIPPKPGAEPKKTIAQCSQLRAISKRRINYWKGQWHLPPDKMAKVDRSLIALLRPQFGAAETMKEVAATTEIDTDC